jgi:hypothetical protein
VCAINPYRIAISSEKPDLALPERLPDVAWRVCNEHGDLPTCTKNQTKRPRECLIRSLTPAQANVVNANARRCGCLQSLVAIKRFDTKFRDRISTQNFKEGLGWAYPFAESTVQKT